MSELEIDRAVGLEAPRIVNDYQRAEAAHQNTAVQTGENLPAQAVMSPASVAVPAVVDAPGAPIDPDQARRDRDARILAAQQLTAAASSPAPTAKAYLDLFPRQETNGNGVDATLQDIGYSQSDPREKYGLAA